MTKKGSGGLSNLTEVTQPVGNTAGLEHRSSVSKSVLLILIHHEYAPGRRHWNTFLMVDTVVCA